MELLWWHWVVLALVLIGIEMMTPTFFLMWMGLGALFTGLVVGAFNPGFALQLTLWVVATGVMTVVWLRYFRNPDRTHAGQAREGVLGIVGLVTRAVPEMGEGEIMFQRPVLGSDRWPAVADAPIPAGEKAKIVDVQGQTLKVAQL